MKRFGADTEYRTLHQWVRDNKTPSKICEKCGNEKPIGRLDLANISGEYKKDVDALAMYARKHKMKY